MKMVYLTFDVAKARIVIKKVVHKFTASCLEFQKYSHYFWWHETMGVIFTLQIARDEQCLFGLQSDYTKKIADF
jgi:uncharacterized protein involved in tolerance to divalent cations